MIYDQIVNLQNTPLKYPPLKPPVTIIDLYKNDRKLLKTQFPSHCGSSITKGTLHHPYCLKCHNLTFTKPFCGRVYFYEIVLYSWLEGKVVP